MREIPSVGLLLIASAAFAQSPKVGVVAYGLDAASEREALTAERVLLETGLSGHPGAVDLFESARAAQRSNQDEKLKKGNAAVASAGESIDGLEFPAAVAKLNDAVAALEDCDWTTNFGALTNALAVRAVAMHLNGTGSEADAALGQLFAASPNFRFPEGRWSPDVRSWVEAGRQTSQQSSQVSVNVKASAPASVWVDGLYRGVAPLEVSGLLPGNHYVSVLGLGSALAQRTVNTQDGHALEVELEYPRPAHGILEALNAIKADTSTAAIATPGKDLANVAGVDEVLIIGFRTGEGALQTRTLRVTKDGRTATADSPVTGHGEEALTAADRTALATLDKPLGGSAPSSSVAMSADDLQSRRTWSYVAAGSGAAALIVGIALGANVQGQVNSARANTSLTNDQYASAIHSAQVTAGVADGFYALAAVGIGLGGWLFYTSLSGSSDSAPAKSPEPDTTFSIAPTSGGGAFVLSGHF